MLGRTISHFKITEKLGEGGMGVVYKAEDTNLKRPVALKFLAAHLLGDEDVKARFRREAEAAAALNHSNICTVHQIDEFEGKTFIAMVFLEGEGLDKKIEAGPLKLKDALDIAIQTAKGLQAAHGKGIVHRDIKPANLMIGEDGHVTIMDFGLAQLADRSKLTRMDETMGTVTYMSPEQTYGADIDHRSDIWSLGVVLYEMVVGEQPFKGHYDKAVMYSITNEEPEPMTALRTGVPMELELLVNKCLAKEAGKRYQTTADMVVDLESLSDKLKSGRSTIMPAAPASAVVTGAHAGLKQGQAESPSLPGPLARYRVIEDAEEREDSIKYVAEDTELHRSVAIRVLPQSSEQQIERAQRRKQILVLGIGALGVLLALVFAFFPLFSSAPVAETAVRRFSFSPENVTQGRISPDGKHILYVTNTEGERVLWVRPLDSETSHRLEGTDGARGGYWSPDSRSIVFGTYRELKRVALDGGNPMTLCELPETGGNFPFWGASVSPDGNRIVFSSGLRLYEIAARGGEPKLLFEQDESDESKLFWAPHFLPSGAGSEGLLYTGAVGQFYSRVGLLNLRTGERRELTAGDRAVYSQSGHLVYRPGSSIETGLRALPFSIENLTVTGEPFPIEEAGRSPSVAEDGTLTYIDSGRSTRLRQLVRKDRTGTTLGKIGQPQSVPGVPSLSPDGRLVAVHATENGNTDIWLHEVDRPVKTRLTFHESMDLQPKWLPSGDAIAFSSGRSGKGGNLELYVQRIGGNSTAEPLLKPDPSVRRWVPDWSRDARLALFYERPSSDAFGHDLWYLERGDDGSSYQAVPFLQTRFSEITPQFSPDEKWVAYASNESGRYEVYVRSFPDGGGQRLVSVNGGGQPRWSDEGGELFYVEQSTLMAVPVSTRPTLTIGKPRRLFSSGDLGGVGYRYDITPDGQQFVMTEAAFTDDASAEAESDGEPQTSIRVVENWYEEFRDREQD
jgi:Tol biopolymer transport system component/predicted Ser/Thr protein kinase